MTTREDALKRLRRHLAAQLALYGAVIVVGLIVLWWMTAALPNCRCDLG